MRRDDRECRRDVYTHLLPCASFGQAVWMPGTAWGFLFWSWQIQMIGRGEVFSAQEQPHLACQFSGAWGAFVFQTEMKLQGEVTRGLMDTLGVQQGVFNRVESGSR